MKIEKPNYTQVPNVLLDKMVDFTHTEFKVMMLICRQTFGWQRARHNISYSFFMESTGLCREAVNNAIFSLVEKGVLNRRENGNSFTYWLNVDGVEELGGSLANEPIETSLPNEPILNAIGLLNEPKSVCLVDTKKERKKSIKEKSSDEDFIKSLKTEFTWIDIEAEISRMRAWILANPGRQLTRRFMVGWLNRIPKPVVVPEKKWQPDYIPQPKTNHRDPTAILR